MEGPGLEPGTNRNYQSLGLNSWGTSTNLPLLPKEWKWIIALKVNSPYLIFLDIPKEWKCIINLRLLTMFSDT